MTPFERRIENANRAAVRAEAALSAQFAAAGRPAGSWTVDEYAQALDRAAAEIDAEQSSKQPDLDALRRSPAARAAVDQRVQAILEEEGRTLGSLKDEAEYLSLFARAEAELYGGLEASR